LSGFLLDTNVVSELVNPQPHPGVTTWYTDRPVAALHLSTIVVAEIKAGIEGLPTGRRRRVLEAWLADLLEVSFVGRVLDFDLEAALVYGRISAAARRAGRPAHVADAQIAAVATVHGLTVATRDIIDFAGFGVPLVNPFEGA